MTPLKDLSWHDLLRRLKAEVQSRSEAVLPVAGVDEAWQETLVRIRGYAERLLSERQNLSPEDVDDIAQAVLLKLQSPAILGRLQQAQNPIGYLVVMTRNAAHDLARRRSVERSAAPLLSQGSLSQDDIQGKIERQRQAQWLLAELRSLPVGDRRLLHMRFWEGMRIADIAKTLSLPYSRVAVRLFRLLRKLEARSRHAPQHFPQRW